MIDGAQSLLAIGEELTADDWIFAGAIVVATLAVAIIVARLIRHAFARAMGDGLLAGLLARIGAYMVIALGTFYALTTLGVQVGPLLGALGLGGLVIALALQKVVENFVGAIILQTKRPFTVGDTIEVEGTVGVVRDVDGRETVLTGLDGTEYRIPNGNVIATRIHNLTRQSSRRSEIVVGVAYDTDLEAAHDAILAALERVPRVLVDPAPLVVLREFATSSIDFSVYVWHASDVPSELAARHDVVLAIHREFADNGIVIAFPQVVVWSGETDESGPYAEPRARVHTSLPVPPPRDSSQRARSRLRRPRAGGGAERTKKEGR